MRDPLKEIDDQRFDYIGHSLSVSWVTSIISHQLDKRPRRALLLVGAGVRHDLPCSVGLLFPDKDVLRCLRDRLSVFARDGGVDRTAIHGEIAGAGDIYVRDVKDQLQVGCGQKPLNELIDVFLTHDRGLAGREHYGGVGVDRHALLEVFGSGGLNPVGVGGADRGFVRSARIGWSSGFGRFLSAGYGAERDESDEQ
jgi:hypothetical protein